MCGVRGSECVGWGEGSECGVGGGRVRVCGVGGGDVRRGEDAWDRAGIMRVSDSSSNTPSPFPPLPLPYLSPPLPPPLPSISQDAGERDRDHYAHQ